MKQTLDIRRIGIFLFFAFGIAWAFGLWVYLTGGLLNSPELVPGTGITLALALIALGYMWAPALAHILTRVLTREGWKESGLGLRLERWGTWAGAWFLPAILTFLGITVFFLILPQHFDANLSALSQMIAALETQVGEALPFSLWTLVLLQLGVGTFIAPFINGF